MNLVYFGSVPADIRIRINPDIRIRILAHLAEFVLFAFTCTIFGTLQERLVPNTSVEFIFIAGAKLNGATWRMTTTQIKHTITY